MMVKFRVKVLFGPLATVRLIPLVELTVVSLLVFNVDMVVLAALGMLAGWDVLSELSVLSESDDAVTITVSVKVPEGILQLACSDMAVVVESVDDSR